MSLDPAVAAVVFPTAQVLFTIAVGVAVVRIIRGPAILDRMISTDVLLSALMCAVGTFILVTGRVDLLFLMLTMAFFGFVGSVAVSRYVARSESTPAPPAEPAGTAEPTGTADAPASAEAQWTSEAGERA